MEIKLLKLDFFSVSLSLLLHILFFISFHISSAFNVKSYEVVDLDTFSMDMNVKSKVLSKVSNMGKDFPHSDSFRTELPSGEMVRESASKGGASVKKGVGERSSNISASKRVSVGSKRESFKGIGDVHASFSITNSEKSGNFKFESSVKSSYDRIVPYILEIKKRIRDNWKNPYLKVDSKKVVVLQFELFKDGSMSSFSIEKLSNDMLFNRSAVNAVYLSQPFPKMPDDVELNKIKLRIKFEVE